MINAKQQHQQSQLSLSATQRAGPFAPRQVLGSPLGSSACAWRFTPSLFRPTQTRVQQSRSRTSTGRKVSANGLTRSEVAEVVRLVICSTSSKVHHLKLKEDSQLKKEFGFDHLDFLHVAMALEKAFNLQIPLAPSNGAGANIDKYFVTPRSIVDFVCQCLCLPLSQENLTDAK